MSNKKGPSLWGCFAILVNFMLGLAVCFIGIFILQRTGINIDNTVNTGVQFIKEFLPDDFVIPFSSENQNRAEGSPSYSPLPVNGERQFILNPLDQLGRATGGHIQLQYKDKPTLEREGKISIDPVGWHNYKYKADVDGSGHLTEEWLMNRGHLIGYLFSGDNGDKRNLIPITRYLNAGTTDDRKTDRANYNSMLFYEMGLNDWLKANQNHYLDYYVQANYFESELLPRSVTLYWTAFDANGQQVMVQLSNSGLSQTDGLVSRVELSNSSPNATLNYNDGTSSPVYP